MLILISFSFLAGIVTILSPCILPVLPVVLSSSLTGGRRRPYGVILGFILSFTFFTLALTAIVRSTGLPPDILRTVAVVIILFFGVSLLIPKTQALLERMFSNLSRFTPQNQLESSGGFGGGILVGMSLGLVWTPCAGPILASVITLAVTSSVTFEAVLVTMAYSIGTAIPMLLIILGGRRLLIKMPFLVRNSARIQKFFGIVIILVAVAIHFNLDRKFQAYILEVFPNYGANLTKLEDLEIVKEQLKQKDIMKAGDDLCDSDYGRAPGFEGGGTWLNSEPLTMEGLRGKVVLVDFWTYTCINCIRTLPFITGWDEKYRDDGLVIVGVHTPEFEFEKNTENVKEAIKDFGIKYPVVQDNDYKIWRSYANRYWPAKYFIDKAGCIRKTHFGEGEYVQSERFIQKLLAETGVESEKDLLGLEEHEFSTRTPETYLGYLRMSNFVSPENVIPDEYSQYSVPQNLEQGEFSYGGMWNIGDERSMSEAGSTLEINFLAKEVFLVMRADKEAGVKIYIDGEEVVENAGEDAVDGIVTVNKDRLYKLIKLEESEQHRLKLEFLNDGVEVYAFTFG